MSRQAGLKLFALSTSSLFTFLSVFLQLPGKTLLTISVSFFAMNMNIFVQSFAHSAS